MVTENYVPPIAPIHHTTDIIISQYENILCKRISSKVLSASKTGKPALFTDEEVAYLTKKSTDENLHTEVSIDTSVPDLTLKKGGTEINIKHAALLVKKMEEKYPTASSNILKDPFLQIPSSIEPQVVKSVNKNAYEIRLDVLKEAIQWLSLEVNMPTTVNQDPEYHSGDAVISLAKKFYSFVENRRY